MTKEDWIKEIKLIKYKRLAYKCNTNMEFFEKLKLRDELLKSGFTEESLDNELKLYFENEINNIEDIITEKARKLMLDKKELLSNKENLDTNEYIEIYYRIEQILAYGLIGAKILTNEEENANVKHLIKNKGTSYIFSIK